jgi:hypothetical protein
MWTILIATDAAGSFPWVKRDDEPLPTDGLRWQLVAETDDPDIGAQLLALTARRCREARRTRVAAIEAGA